MFGEDAPVVGQAGIDGLHRLQIALEAPGEIALAGKVRTVADPDRQRLGAERLADLDTFEIVLDGLLPDSSVGMDSEPNL